MELGIRKNYIDNLRWITILILIPYHTAQAWNVWGEPNYIIFEGNRWISSIVVFFSPYFMPLLFVLAGISTKFALQKRTSKEYLNERVKKLFVPLVFGTMTFMPIMSYIGNKFNYAYSDGFLKHYTVFFTKYTDLTGADGGFSLGQFWFLLYLLIISIISVGILYLWKKIIPLGDNKFPLWLVCMLGLPLLFISDWLSIGGKSFVEYTYLFLIGYIVFGNEKVVYEAEKKCWLLLVIGLAAAILNVYFFIWIDKEVILLNTFAKCVSEWMMIIALLGLAKKHFDFKGKISNYMQKRSFLIYIYHFIWVVLFQYLLHEICGNHTVLLFIGTLLLAYVMTFVCCEISIRIPFLCFVTGTKYGSDK